MDLETRRNIAACMRVGIRTLPRTMEARDIIVLLQLWEYGLVSGIPATAPPIDPSRETGHHPE